MVESLAFTAMKNDILKIVNEIPQSRVTTASAIGEHLMVPARYIAFILAQLTETERLLTPWYRVVATNGKITNSGLARGQSLKLAAEGIPVNRKDHVDEFCSFFVHPAEFATLPTRNQTYLEEIATAR